MGSSPIVRFVMRAQRLTIVALALSAVFAGGCTHTLGEGDPDVEAARSFDAHPLYWVGERFGDWDLEHVGIRPGAAVFSYGTCETDFGEEGGCAVPLQIQIQPLCAYLDAVARAPIWKTRSVRGAPVGTIDSAPVLFTDRVQVKVYRGQNSDPGLAMDALRALRSVNDVAPMINVDDPIPGASHAILSGAEPCSD